MKKSLWAMRNILLMPLAAADFVESLKTVNSADEVSSSRREDLSDVRVAEGSESDPKKAWDAVRKRIPWDRKRVVWDR